MTDHRDPGRSGDTVGDDLTVYGADVELAAADRGAAMNACSAPLSEPVNTTPPATAGWTPSSTPVDAVHDRAPVAASNATRACAVGLFPARIEVEACGEIVCTLRLDVGEPPELGPQRRREGARIGRVDLHEVSGGVA